MATELIEYCISDVEILRRACDKFQKMFRSDCDICPLTEAVSIGSTCDRVFRKKN